MQPPVIEYRGEILANVGYGAWTRHWFKGLEDRVKFVPKEDYVKPENKLDDSYWIQQLVKSSIKTSPNIIFNFGIPQAWHPEKGKFNIGCPLWEGSIYPMEWIEHINTKCNALMVPSEHMKVALSKVTSLPIKVFNAHYSLDDILESTSKKTVNNTEGKVKYFYRGQFNWINNIDQLVKGFTLAFGGFKDAVLIIKLDLPEYSVNTQKGAQSQIRQFLSELINLPSANIVVITDNLSEENILAIQRDCHYYIDVEKATAIPINTIKAKACGLPIIGTLHGNSAPTELVIESHYIPCTQYRGLYWDSNQWVNAPNMDKFFEKLRYSYKIYHEDKDKYKEYKKENLAKIEWLQHTSDLVEVAQSLYNQAIVSKPNFLPNIPGLNLN